MNLSELPVGRVKNVVKYNHSTRQEENVCLGEKSGLLKDLDLTITNPCNVFTVKKGQDFHNIPKTVKHLTIKCVIDLSQLELENLEILEIGSNGAGTVFDGFVAPNLKGINYLYHENDLLTICRAMIPKFKNLEYVSCSNRRNTLEFELGITEGRITSAGIFNSSLDYLTLEVMEDIVRLTVYVTNITVMKDMMSRFPNLKFLDMTVYSEVFTNFFKEVDFSLLEYFSILFMIRPRMRVPLPACLPNLVSLNIEMYKYAQDYLREIYCPKLRRLGLGYHCLIDGCKLEHSLTSKLEYLSIDSYQHDIRDIALDNIVELTMRRCEGELRFKSSTTMEHLESIVLFRHNGDLGHLTLPKLKTLSLTDCVDMNVKNLKKIKMDSVETLTLKITGMSRFYCGQSLRLPNLVSLTVSGICDFFSFDDVLVIDSDSLRELNISDVEIVNKFLTFLDLTLFGRLDSICVNWNMDYKVILPRKITFLDDDKDDIIVEIIQDGPKSARK